MGKYINVIVIKNVYTGFPVKHVKLDIVIYHSIIQKLN